MSRALLALDLDGTLLRTDGTLDDRDAAAVRRALDAGIHVTLATGRVATGTLPTARALGIENPLVCADGGLIVDGKTGERIEQIAIALSTANAIVDAYYTHDLAPFILTHDAIHCDESGRPVSDYLRVWTEEMYIHDDIANAHHWRRDGEIALTIGIGDHDAVAAAHSRLISDHSDRLDVIVFKVFREIERWAILTRPYGCTKGTGLERVAKRLNVDHEHTAVVGDWHNDIPMFRWSRRSFVMARAPLDVRAEATDELTAPVGAGGGVAEAIARWRGI
jgi:Cof subfamily protein (haloacid dehalogenase superfamily)